MGSRRRRRPTFSSHNLPDHPIGNISDGDIIRDAGSGSSDTDNGNESSYLRHHGSQSTLEPLIRNTSTEGPASPIDARRRSTVHSRSFATNSTFVDRWLHRASHSGGGRPSFSADVEDEEGLIGIHMGDQNQHPIEEADSVSLKSKPSTRRSSFDSDIDDVCMPLDSPAEERYPYTDIPIDHPHGRSKPWPDLQVLDEFCAKEREDLQHTEAAELARQGLRYPEAGSRLAVNEAEAGGRLRPPHPVPWGKPGTSSAPPAADINIPRLAPSFRFTYFRDDLPATIHSATISGLLRPDQSSSDLFPPVFPNQQTEPLSRVHTHKSSTPSHTPATQAHTPAPNHSSRAASAQPPASSHLATAESHAPSPDPHLHPHHVHHHSSASSDNLATVVTADGVTAVPSGNSRPASVKSNGLDPQETYPNGTNSTTGANGTNGTHVDPVAGTSAGSELSTDDESGPFWLDIQSPTEDEMRIISKTFGIHPLTTEDILLQETREKVELFHNYYFVCFTAVDVNTMRAARTSRSAAAAASAAENGHYPSTSAQKHRRDSFSGRSMPSREGNRRSRDRLRPLAVYTIVFHTGVITIHYKPTPHTINVRRRIRLLRDYLNISSDWISYALIDDITDGFGPLINSIEENVNSIEDAILKMHDSDDSDSDSDWDESHDEIKSLKSRGYAPSRKSSSTSESGSAYREWRRKGDMLRWIGEARKRVMGVLSLLSNKADVIKGFSKRVTDQWSGAPRSDIALYLSDIQDHLVTMVQSLNHYEKLLARSHSNYLAQINIDMTKANNDMNDTLGKISVLGTIVLPMNIVTGLWGMNVLVPGQGVEDSLRWFWGIIVMMITISVTAYWAISRYV